QACVTPHVWLSRADALDHPDQMVFDLDPPDAGGPGVHRAARHLKRLLEDLDLRSYVKTSGSRGFHVLVPLDRRWSFDQVRAAAQDLAAVLVHRHPGELTVEQRKDKRGSRVFVDVLRNAYAQTIVPPYAVRPRQGAPVATPLDWGEVGST